MTRKKSGSKRRQENGKIHRNEKQQPYADADKGYSLVTLV
jgi:hypothetical protein